MRGAGRPELEAHFSKLSATGEPLSCVAYGIHKKQGWDALIDLAVLAMDSTAMGPKIVDEGFALGMTPQRLFVARARRIHPMLSITLELEVQSAETVLAGALRGSSVAIETRGADTFMRGRLGSTDVDVVFRVLAAFPDSGRLGVELTGRIRLALESAR